MHFPVLQVILQPLNAPTDFLQSHPHSDRALLVLPTTQCLRETICRHILRGDILQPNDLIHDRIPDEVMTDVDMFGLSMTDRIFRESDRTLIIGAEDRCLFSWTLAEFREELPHPFEFFRGFC